MKRVWGRALIVLIVVVAVVSVGLVSTAPAEERKEILIGASLPLTGSVAPHGRDLKWAYELAVSTVNSKGGIFVKDLGKKLKVKLIIADNGTNTMKSATLVEKLANHDKVDMMLGGGEPMTVLGDCLAAEKNKIYYHTAFGFPAFLWKQKKFKWSTDFFVSADELVTPPFELLKAMDNQQRPKKMALIVEDTFAGKGMLDVCRKKAKSYGVKVPLELKLPLNSTGFSQQVSKIRETGVDCMIIFAPPKDLETFVLELKKNKLNVPFIYTFKGAWAGQFWKDLGKDAQYIVADGFWSMDYPFEGAKELGEKYRETFGEYSITVGMFHALAQILFQAIEKAGSLDGAKVRAAVLSHRFDTVMGPVKYDEVGHAGFSPVSGQWWDGKQMLVYPSNYAIWKVKLAPPWDQR